MSVINTMLKDLELRGGNDAAGEEVLRGLSSASHTSYRPVKEVNYYLVSALSALVVMLVMVILYLVSPFHLMAEKNETQVAVGKLLPTSFENNKYAAVVEAESNTPAVSRPVPAVVQAPAPVVHAAVKQVEVAHEAAIVENRPVQQSVATTKTSGALNKKTAEADDEDIGTEQEITKTQREPSNEEKGRQAYLNALSMYNRGRVQESRTLLKDALNYDAANLDARKLLASIYLRENRADIAITLIDKGLTNHADNQSLLRLFLQAKVQLEDYAGAIALMEQRLHMKTPEDIAYLAGLYQKNDGHLSAIKLYSQALQLKPARSIWWMGQGISFEALSQQDAALKSYQQSIASGQLSAQLADYVKDRINLIEQTQQKAAS